MQIKRSWILVLFLFSLGCKEDVETIPKKEVVTVFFDSQSKLKVREDDTSEIVLPISLSAVQPNPVIVFYETIGQEVVNGSDFEIVSGNPLTIAAGSKQTSLTIKINNNEIVQPEQRAIYIRLRNTDQSNVKLAVPKEVVVEITEDDCLANISSTKIWIGALKIQSQNETLSGTGVENTTGLCSGSFNITGKLVGNQNPESTVTLSLLQDAPGSKTGAASIARAKLFTFTSQYDIEATGNYNEETKKITLDYSIFDLVNSSNNFNDTLIITVDE